MKKDQLFKLGAPSDTERLEAERSIEDQRAKVADAQAMIQKGYAVNSKDAIEDKLLPTSLVPLKVSELLISIVLLKGLRCSIVCRLHLRGVSQTSISTFFQPLLSTSSMSLKSGSGKGCTCT